MKRVVYEGLGKVFIVLLAISIFVGSGYFLKNQTTVAPENPITQTTEKAHIPIQEIANTHVDQDILDMDSNVTEAQNEQYDGDSVPTSKELLDRIGEGSETKQGNENPVDEQGNTGKVPGGGNFALPADRIYFFVSLIDVKDPYPIDDPRCYYKITHMYPQLTVEKVAFYDNNEPIKYYGDNPNKGFINLVKGENWLTVRVTYRFPNGDFGTFERATNPPMVRLYDPLDIDFSDTNLKYSYDDPEISFYVKPKPTHAQVQVFINGRLAPIDNRGNYNVTLREGENQVTFRGTANGFNHTELTKKVVYQKTKIKVYSPELEALDYRKTNQEYLEKTI